MAPTDPPIGAVVEIPAGRGIVRFSGSTSFSAGKWVGIELEDPTGKNDGIVQGVKYFTCKPLHGMFVRPSQVKAVLSLPEPTPAPPPAVSRATLGHQRTESTGLSRTNTARSINSVRAGSPSKTSSASVSPNPSAGVASPSRAKISAGASPARRQPSISTHPRVAARRTSVVSDAPPSPNLLKQRSTDAFPQDRVHKLEPSLLSQSPPSASILSSSPLQQSHLRRVATPPPAPSPEPIEELPPTRPSTPPQPPPPDDTELQELRAKIRVFEIKRADDARHIRELETRLSEAESFVALRPKLQAKLNQLQTELIATKRELADAQQLSQLSDNRVADWQEQLEMSMLDKEVAEERAEAAELEVEELKERLAIVEVELQHVRDGGNEEGGGSSGENAKHSLPYIQLEKQNERLKEALIRLRDISQETDQEQKRRIAEMESDVAEFDELQSQYESTLIKLANAEVQIDDLKAQLDDALGAEEMLVQLTERNLELGEKIEEMRVTIEDLEALKELNDELEENHIETERAMQEDLNAKDVEIREQARKIQMLEDACQDLEGTIVQFRELVMQLQSELDALRAETQTAQHESATAVSQSAAMMSLNLKLQSSATKNQARAIELELRRIEAKEAREMLEIIQPYLPQIYVETDMDATNTYIFFQRLAAKIDLINTFVAQAHNLPDALNGPVSEALVGICELRGRLSNLSIVCQRFAAILRRCDVESFLNIGRVYADVAPMEKRIDMHIELLRREEFRAYECVSDAAKMQSQFDHLVETYFNGFDFDLGERELGYALSCDYDLEMFSASIGLIKTAIAGIMKDEDQEVDLDGVDSQAEFFEPLQKLLDQCRAVKVLTRKLAKRLEDLIGDSAAAKAHLVPQLKSLSENVPELVNFGFSLAQQVMPHLSEVRASKAAFKLVAVLDFVKKCAASTIGKNNKDGPLAWDAVGEFFTKVGQEVNTLIQAASESENVQKISGIAPWVTRIPEVKSATAVNVEAERKLAQLNDEMQALVRTLKAKDQHIQESVVKIELMERRMEGVKKQGEMIADLETELQKARKQERAYEEAMEQLQSDLDALEQDNKKLKAAASSVERQATVGVQPVETENVQVEGSLETSYLLEQIDALRRTVRFLRTENSFLKGQDLLREIEALPRLPTPVLREPTPPLTPSGLSDTDDSDSEGPATPISLTTLAAESKLLYREVFKYTASPRVVDLTSRTGKDGQGRAWVPKKKTPAYQVWQRRMEGEKLSRRVKGLLERTNTIQAAVGR
ncbi:dynactin [Phanerochaete sordida]|uniref:Dynactin n=1 Tax=Phanerochaete sordida TaxID=48140 RepID=A0A9P3LBN2_9APHY|nr:dynactin [Phanerochaete sordida]